MQRISLMYYNSKGMVPERTCGECGNYFEDGKRRCCLCHSLDAQWKPDWMACRYFTTENNAKIAELK